MTQEIISALIGAAATIIAALITVFFAGKIVKENTDKAFHSYTDKTHDLKNITQKAQSDIIIVVAVGNNLLPKYGREFEKRLKSGICIYYLLLDEHRFQEMERYLHGDDAKDISARDGVIRRLTALKEKYPDLLQVRVFHDFMSVSYVGIDIWPNRAQGCALPSSVVQAMLYQYHVGAKQSPITYFSPKADKEHYATTVQVIKDMWWAGEDLFQPGPAGRKDAAAGNGGATGA